MATQAIQRPISGPTLTATPRRVSWKIEVRPQQPLGAQPMAARASQRPISGPTLTATPQGVS